VSPQRWIYLGVLLILLALVLAEWSIYGSIREQAVRDESRTADAIVVFGAAEYNGAPSPVFRARLDHAFALEEQGLAPVLITSGGSGGDRSFTEAGVGRDYLMQRGMGGAKILTDTRSETTYQTVKAISRLLKERHARTCIAVSDGFHLYRIRLMFAHEGITAYGSPATASPIEADPVQRVLHSCREVLRSSLWYLGYRG
jgi:uncharacterized SAM-binding protein YcdF (DUF218 family)